MIAVRDLVRTRAYTFVADALRTDDHVFVYGTPGSGKTTLSLMLMDHYLKENYDVRLIRSPREFEIMNQIKTNVRTFIVFDDIFGHFSPSPKEYFTYRHLFDDICSLFPNKHSNDSDAIHDQKVKVLFNCRTNVFCDTEPLIREYRHKLFGVTYSLNRDLQSDSEERKLIFNAHLVRSHINVSDADVDKVVNLTYTTLGFPLICQLYSYQRKAVREKVVEFFSSPLKFLVQILEELFHAEESLMSAAFLVLLMLNNGNIDTAKLLDPNNSMGMEKLHLLVGNLPKDCSLPAMLSVAAKGMVNSYLTIEDNSFMFSHPTIYDAVALIIGKKNPIFILENCSLSFIVERVGFESDTSVSVDRDLLITLGPNYKEKLLTRLAEEINEEMPLVLSQRSLVDGDTFQDFIEILQKSNKLLHVLHLRDKTDSMSFLFWAAYTRIWQEDFFKILHTEISDFKDVELIEACLGSCIVGNKLVLESVIGNIDDTKKEKLITYKMQDITEGSRTVLTKEKPMPYPKRRTPNDDQLIHIVSICGHSELLPVLLEVGTNPNTSGGLAMTPLMYACYFDHLNLVQILKEKGADPLLMNDDCDNCLHLAVKAGSTDVVKYLLEELKMDPDVKGRNDRTPLMYAGYDNHLDIVEILIRNKATLNPSPAINRNNVLHEAAHHGSTRVVEYLVDIMDVNTAAYKCRTALMLACSNGHLDTVRVLLQHGAKIDDIVDYHENTCYHMAAQGGNVEVMKVLQEHSNTQSSLDCINFKDQTPLMNAVYFRKKKMSDYIVKENSSSAEHCDMDGASCLHLAAQSGNQALLGFFLERGLDKNKKAYKDWTPIIYAMNFGNFETFQCLMNIDSKLLDNKCLYHACAGGNMRIVTTLMDTKATYDTTRLLDAACKSGNEEVLDFVMTKFKEDPLCSTSCLHIAVYHGNKNIVIRLLEMGVDINQKNYKDQNKTPVMSACQKGHLDIVKLLVERGAHWENIADRKGERIVHYAAKSSNPKILEYFIEKGVSITSIIEDPSVFHMACTSFATRTADLLLRLGCSVNQPLPGSRYTPLMLPLLNPHPKSLDMVMTLLQHGADVHARANNGDSCLHLVAREKHNICIVRLLLEAGIDINITNNDGYTPLQVAIDLKMFPPSGSQSHRQ